MNIILIVAAVIFLLLCLAANVEIDLMLCPKSFIASHFKSKPKSSPLATTSVKSHENRKLFQEKAKQWYEKNPPEEEHITTFDGLNLYAEKYLQPETSHKWAIFAHGFHAPVSESREYGMYYFEKGYNVLLPMDRANGKSEGKYITMGWIDRIDFLQWIEKIISADNEAEIVLHGVSMGGATVMMLTGEKLPANVKCAVEDCGYTDVYSEFSAQAMNVAHLPPFPIVPLSSFFCKLRAGYGFKEASAIRQVRKSVTPTLFIHGTDDTFVPFDMVKENYEAASCEKQLLVVQNAAHTHSKNLEPELYWNTVFQFVEKYM